MIVHEEMARWGVRGTDDGLIGGMTISLPTVLNFGSPELRRKVKSFISLRVIVVFYFSHDSFVQIVPEVLAGRKRMALAITEPYTGSDVASIRTTAKKTPDGKYYIVNGVKKWITTGTLSYMHYIYRFFFMTLNSFRSLGRLLFCCCPHRQGHFYAFD